MSKILGGPKIVRTPAEVFSLLSRVRKLSVKLLRSSVCETCQFCLLRKLSVQLPRSSVLCQKMKKMSVTPKVVHTPATVSSLGNCPYTCHRQQFYPQFLLWLKLPRSAVVRTIFQTAACGLCTQVNRNNIKHKTMYENLK